MSKRAIMITVLVVVGLVIAYNAYIFFRLVHNLKQLKKSSVKERVSRQIRRSSKKPLYIAIVDNDFEKVKQLIASKKDQEKLEYVNLKEENVTPLFIAAVMGNKKIITYLIDNGAQLNEVPFLFLFSDLKLAKSLIDTNKIDVNAKDKSGMTPLLFAVGKLDVDIKKDVPAKEGIMFKAALALAGIRRGEIKKTYKPYWEFIEYLISKDADINAVDNKGNTVLHIIVREVKDYKKPVAFFLAKGFDLNVTNKEGISPLGIACKYGKTDFVRYILDTAGSNITAENIVRSLLEAVTKALKTLQGIPIVDIQSYGFPLDSDKFFENPLQVINYLFEKRGSDIKKEDIEHIIKKAKEVTQSEIEKIKKEIAKEEDKEYKQQLQEDIKNITKKSKQLIAILEAFKSKKT